MDTLDDAMMRSRLQQVAAYRDLCRRVRRSGRENVFFALLMLFLAYISFRPNGGAAGLVFLLYVGLALLEFAVGLFKVLRPSAEGHLLDGLVLLLFAGWNLGWQGLGMVVVGRPPTVWIVVLGVFLLFGAFTRFRDYGMLRRVFAERPSPDLIAWFDELVHEIRTSDPQTDELAIDLPTTPHMRAKLLGRTAFFVILRGGWAWVAGPNEFRIERERKDHGTGRRTARLWIGEQPYPEFEISDASWENYRKWMAANQVPQQS